MKNSLFIILTFSMAVAFNACTNSTPKSTDVESTTSKSEVYTCTMHPEVHSDKPGDCPECGMKLVLLSTVDTTQMHMQTDTISQKK